MAANILILLGSPRKKGNSAILAAKLAEAASADGANVETVYLNGLDIKPCQGCDGCQRNPAAGCVIEDDMNQLYPNLLETDSIVIVSPIYWFNISAQAKTVIDRFYAVAAGKNKNFRGKNFGVILTYADPDPFSSGAVNALRSFQDMCGYLDANLEGMVYGSGYAVGEIEKREDVMEKAVALGKRLATAKMKRE